MLIHLMRPIRSARGRYKQGFFIVFIFFLTVSWLFSFGPEKTPIGTTKKVECQDESSCHAFNIIYSRSIGDVNIPALGTSPLEFESDDA